jgi:hypothetical protein
MFALAEKCLDMEESLGEVACARVAGDEASIAAAAAAVLLRGTVRRSSVWVFMEETVVVLVRCGFSSGGA